MEDMASKISELLSSPDGLDKIKSVADALFGDYGTTASPPINDPKPSDNSDSGGLGFSLPDGFDISKIMGLMSAFNNQKNDRRTELLLALKPHLSEERRERVDKAVKILKIVSILPALKEQGLLDIL